MHENHESIAFERQKQMIIELDFREINKTVKIRQRNIETLACKSIRETSRYCWCTSKGGWLFTKISLPFVTTRPLKCNYMVINGLFHTKRSKCLDVHASEKIIFFVTSIIWIICLQRHAKLLFKINYSCDLDQTTRFIII